MWLLERKKRKTLNNIGKYTFKKRVWIFAVRLFLFTALLVAAVKSMMIRPLRNGDASSAASRIVLLNQRIRYCNAAFQ